MLNYFLVSLGGAIGSAARFGSLEWSQNATGRRFLSARSWST